MIDCCATCQFTSPVPGDFVLVRGLILRRNGQHTFVDTEVCHQCREDLDAHPLEDGHSALFDTDREMRRSAAA